MGFSRSSIFTALTNKKWIRMLWLSAAIISVWFFLGLFPWQVKLQNFIWIKLGIALLIFMVPGISIYGLLADWNVRRINHITFGFVISHLILAFAGTLGRVAHVSFDLIKNSMMALGIIFLLLYLLPKIFRGFSLRIDRTTLKRAASFWTLVLVSVLVSLIVIQRVLSDDDLSYLAFLTNTQYATHLSFNDIFFGLAQPVSSRFWLMSAPFAQAFLAELSGVPGLLILGGYYEPFLVVISILCWYELARTLRLSREAASASVILQILFLLLLSEYLHPGAPFFHQLSADKATAAFILAPIFLQSEIQLLRDTTRNNFILCLLAGLSLTLMHPIALAYSVFIGGMLIVLNTNREKFRARFAPLLVIFIVLLPQIVLRFLGTRMEENVPYSLDVILSQNGIENMITLWGGTQFYGFNPHTLEMTFPYGSRISFLEPVLKWGWLLIPVFALVFAVRKLRQSDVAQYIFSAFLLCALAGLPFTGWIIGYFLSAWALERTIWLFPFGLSAVFLLLSIRDETAFGGRLGEWVQKAQTMTKVSNLPLVVVTLFTSLVILLFMREQGLPDLQKFQTKSRRYEDIAQAGQYLDQHIQTQAFVMGSEDLNDLIPGISSKAKLITFRTSDFFSMSLFPLDEIKERISDRQMIFSETVSPEARLGILKKYDVRFLLLQRVDYDLFADLVSSYPSLLTANKVGRFFVIEIHVE